MKLLNVEFGFEVEPKSQTPSLIEQVHGTRIIPFPELKTNPFPEADGVATHCTTPIHVFTADCLPVLIFSEDPIEPVVALHAGWRGALAGIVEKALKYFDLEQAHVIFGPALGQCCFEVKQDFIDAFDRANKPVRPYLKERNGSQYFSLVDFVVGEELKHLKPSHIHREFFKCTYCDPSHLPSYRRNKTTDPRIRSWIRKI
jgi:polyphenol oxidase